ncbi:MAG: YbaK/EbsC family protein [Dehalococcoidia bacterium]
MVKDLQAGAQRVQDALVAQGLPGIVVELPNSTRTAKEAAQAIGCRVEQIAKSIVFQTAETRRPVLVVASGINRIDEAKLAELAGERVAQADADFVHEHTGFAIGGVAPIGHPESLEMFIDEDLLRLDQLWAAAGTPFSVFALTPADLQRMTGGRVAKLKA